ncbi:MAG: response regulator [Pyrinomonadaceae bacterium]|nr:response regulator [Pyrinomonadaceae bacterium]
MKKQSDSPIGTATALEPDAGQLFSELGLSATFFDSMPAEIVVVGLDGTILASNDHFRESYGDLSGKMWTSLLAMDAAEAELQLRNAANKQVHSFESAYKTNGNAVQEFRIDAYKLDTHSTKIALVHRPLEQPQYGFWDPKQTVQPDLGIDTESAQEFYRVFTEQSEYEIARFDLEPPIKVEAQSEFQISEIVRGAKLVFHSKPNLDGDQAISVQEKGISFGGFFGSTETAGDIARAFVDSSHRLLRTELIESTRDGKELYFHTNLLGVIEQGKLCRLWLSRRDITLRKQAEKAYLVAEDQLRQSQKIEPIGRLAGGIAHDFNNFLAVIMLQVEMMRQEIDEDNPLNKRISEISGVTNKAANMVKQLLAFGRKQTMRPQNVVLNDVVEEFIKMIKTLIGEDIEIIVDIDKELGVCYVDPNQMTQILMNLAVNAKDAMTDGGELTISTKNLSIDSNTFKHRAQRKGKYIELAVKDTGIGMTASTRKHVFEPFFTTKEAHKGTGLGLATVYGIVKQSKGFIWVDSKLDEGTTFKVQFPRVDRAAAAVKLAKAETIPRGNETVLLVEDEDLIRETSSEVLTSLGYKVLVAKDGEEAMRIAKSHENEINLLLTDVVMPKMNGHELAKRIRRKFKNLSVLFMSGYADDIITRHGILEEHVHFLGKPFSPLTLAERVRTALSERA